MAEKYISDLAEDAGKEPESEESEEEEEEDVAEPPVDGASGTAVPTGKGKGKGKAKSAKSKSSKAKARSRLVVLRNAVERASVRLYAGDMLCRHVCWWFGGSLVDGLVR